MGHVLDHFPTYSGSLIGPLSHLQQPHPSIQVPYGSPCVLCQEEGWFTSPCTGLSEVERDHGQELLPPPPHLQCPDLPPWCQVLHHTQPPLGLHQCPNQGGQRATATLPDKP